MKKKYSILLAAAALLAFAPVSQAQYYKDNGNGVAYSKTISEPDSTGIYTITLESFVTGAVTIEQKAVPADIVLVLDYSRSMEQNMYSNTYTSTGVTEFTGDNTRGQTFYYKHTDGVYYPVTRIHRNGGGQRPYQLSIEVNGVTYYLFGTELTTTEPTTPTNSSTTIWTGELYTATQTNLGRKIDKLRESVVGFVEKIQENNETLGLKTGEIGNRIAIVLYSEAAYPEDTYPGLNELIEVTDLTLQNDSEVLYDGDDLIGYDPTSGTNSGDAMAKAKEILDGIPQNMRENRTRTVVMFTDGLPTNVKSNPAFSNSNVSGSNSFNTTVANDCISNAYYIKNTNKAIVYTIGLFGESDKTNQVKTYLEYTSTDYPQATALPTSSSDYLTYGQHYGDYCMVVSDEMDLSEIFRKISDASGGSGNTSMSSAVTTVDVVSASFILPGETDEENLSKIKVKLAKCEGQLNETYQVKIKNEQGDSVMVTRNYLKFGTPFSLVSPNDTIQPALDPSPGSTKNNKISVNGFDYSANWCGPVVNLQGDTTWHGYKLVIEIPIEMDPEATGGPNVETNAQGSGIYTEIDGQLVNVVKFTSPTVSLPVNIFINKLGLDVGESAKFTIERAILPDGWKKPTSSSDSAYDGLPWESVTSVFVTRHFGEGVNDPITKVMGLPSTKSVTENGKTVQKEFVYRVVEEKWSWSYTSTALTPVTTDQLITNPFKFQNTKKDGIDYKIRHAESKATNTFKTGSGDAYDDSKNNNRTVITYSASE